MSRNPLKPIYLVLYSGLFLCLHAVSLTAFRSYSEPISTYPFLILAPALALAACLWRLSISSFCTRLPWAFFCAGLLLWSCGMLLSAWEDLSQHTPFSLAFFSDFVFFLYGVPVLLAISTPAESARLPVFIWIDGLQAVLAACLVYTAIFSVAPFVPGIGQPISIHALTLTYDFENLILAVAAMLRFLSQPEASDERIFYRILGIFLCVYAISAGIYNHISSLTEGHSLDLLVDVPFLFVTAFAISAPKEDLWPAEVAPKKSLALFIDNSSPIFYAFALSTLGLVIIRAHFYLGVASVILTLAFYGVRVVTLQLRYMQSQQALQKARDRLEDLSLRDALTNVANRRCFDQTLIAEWHRAVRKQHPISLLLIDIDFFKTLNDSYGHPYGDQCLVGIAASMQSVIVRSGDLLARYGGEEFAVILPGTGRSGAELVASRLHKVVRSLRIKNETSIGDFATVSIGAAFEDSPQASSPLGLIEAADGALYRAKLNGRDRIELS
jgi:diguanylate cyclase (GGDEF)-like protein